MELHWIYATVNEIRIWSSRSLSGLPSAAGMDRLERSAVFKSTETWGEGGYKDSNFKFVLATFFIKTLRSQF